MTTNSDLNEASRRAVYLTETDELAFLLEEVPRRLRGVFDESIKRFGLTRTQWRTLSYVFRSEGVTQTELAQFVELERASVGLAIDRLEELKYVERRKLRSDRRVWKIYLLPAALELLPTLRDEADAVYEKMLKGVPELERLKLFEILNALKSNLAGG